MSDAHERLSSYLNQHLLAAEAGSRAFRAASRTFAGTSHGDRLADLGREIEQDRRGLEQLIRRLGYAPTGWKRALTGVARSAALVNPVNLWRRRRASTAQLELDVLQGAVVTKRAMWTALAALADTDDRLDRAEMESLARRAEEQVAEIVRVSDETVAERFQAR